MMKNRQYKRYRKQSYCKQNRKKRIPQMKFVEKFNAPNGGFFYSIKWFKDREEEYARFKRRVRENTSPVSTRKMTVEEMAYYFGGGSKA